MCLFLSFARSRMCSRNLFASEGGNSWSRSEPSWQSGSRSSEPKSVQGDLQTCEQNQIFAPIATEMLRLFVMW